MYMRMIMVEDENHWNEHIRLVSSFGKMSSGTMYIAFANPVIPDRLFPETLKFEKDTAEADILLENVLSGKDVTCIFIENKLVWANVGLEFKAPDKYKSIMEYTKAYYDLMKTIEEDK